MRPLNMFMSKIILLVVIYYIYWPLFTECKHTAGVWVDDGHGHTIKAELPPGDAKVLKKHMLDIFGLSKPPRRRRHSHMRNGSAPAFLKSIYDALDERGQAPHLEPHHRASVGAADTIITFVNKNTRVHSLHAPHRRLWFDIADVPLDVSLLDAELRVYRNHSLQYSDEDLTLSIHLGAKDKIEEQIIAKAILPKQGWISYNITAAMLSWIIFPDTNFGLRMGVTREVTKHELHLADVGILGGHDKEDYRPFVVGFFAAPKEIAHSRKIRSIIPKTDYKNPIMTMAKGEDRPRSPPEVRCQKRNLYVSFRDLGWQDWVIAPEGYDANFCDGRCQFPMLANMNATNHAIIQTLVKMKRAVDEGEGPPPDACCAPRVLTTISVLYYDYSDNVVLKKYPEMIVKTCGCI